MRAVAAIIILAASALAIGLTWYLIVYRRKVQARREAELNTISGILHKVANALDAFVAVDPMERMVADAIHGAILDYYVTAGQPVNRRLKAANKARRSIAMDLAVESSWMLLGGSTDEAKKFHREASEALRGNEKEITT